MSSTPWEKIDAETADGILTFRLSSWNGYFDLLETEVFNATSTQKHVYIWRGQRRTDWSLSSSLDRLFEQLGIVHDLEVRVKDHLESFKMAARGRRGQNPAKLDENEWWALGQHYGLATPLLDWTHSPFAASYFAFEERSIDATKYRVIYGLDVIAVQRRNRDLNTGPSIERGRPPIVELIEPMSDENQRLVSQGGLFTRAPVSTPIERWVAEAFEGTQATVLLRILVPDADRIACLRTLNRMNINHLSLFPDLGGASRSTNLKLEMV